MHQVQFLAVALAGALLLGCATADKPQVTVIRQLATEPTVELESIRALGYAAPDNSTHLSPAERSTRTRRAAIVAAYQALAERVHGIAIDSATHLSSGGKQEQSIEVSLSTHLRGAEVIEINPQEDGTYEAVVELSLPKSALANLAQVGAPRAERTLRSFYRSE